MTFGVAYYMWFSKYTHGQWPNKGWRVISCSQCASHPHLLSVRVELDDLPFLIIVDLDYLLC